MNIIIDSERSAKVLIVGERDSISEKFKNAIRGRRFNFVFIHKDNVDKSEFMDIIEPNISVLGSTIGLVYEFNEM